MVVYWCVMFATPLKVHHHLLCFIHIKDGIVGFTPWGEHLYIILLTRPTTVESSAYWCWYCVQQYGGSAGTFIPTCAVKHWLALLTSSPRYSSLFVRRFMLSSTQCNLHTNMLPVRILNDWLSSLLINLNQDLQRSSSFGKSWKPMYACLWKLPLFIA